MCCGSGGMLRLRTTGHGREEQGCGQQIVAWVDSKLGSNSHDLTKWFLAPPRATVCKRTEKYKTTLNNGQISRSLITLCEVQIVSILLVWIPVFRLQILGALRLTTERNKHFSRASPRLSQFKLRASWRVNSYINIIIRSQGRTLYTSAQVYITCWKILNFHF